MKSYHILFPTLAFLAGCGFTSYLKEDPQLDCSLIRTIPYENGETIRVLECLPGAKINAHPGALESIEETLPLSQTI